MKKTRFRGITDGQLHTVLTEHARALDEHAAALRFILKAMGHPGYQDAPAESPTATEAATEAAITPETSPDVTG